MTWTTDKPTTPGFYWYQPDGQRKRVVELRDDGRGLYIVQTGKELMNIGEDEYRWAGPIPEPTV